MIDHLSRFLAVLSPTLAPFASKLVEAGLKDTDAVRWFITLEDEALCQLADCVGMPAFPRQLLRAGLRGLRESGWSIDVLGL